MLIALGIGHEILQNRFVALNSKYFSASLAFGWLWSVVILTLLAMGVILGLFWIVLTRSPKWIGTLYLIVGVFLLLFPIGLRYIAQAVHTIPPIPLLVGSGRLDQYLVPGSLLHTSAGGISMIGLFKVLLRRSKEMVVG